VQYPAIRAAVHIAAIFAIYLAFAMLIPAAVDLYYDNDDWQVFAFCAFFTGGLGLAVALATQGRQPPIGSRFGFFIVNLLWIMTSVIGAVPLLASSLDITLTDAIFEAVAGVTTRRTSEFLASVAASFGLPTSEASRTVAAHSEGKAQRSRSRASPDLAAASCTTRMLRRPRRATSPGKASSSTRSAK
jgi:hypothetical protein